MSSHSQFRDLRGRLAEALRRELMGPSVPEEIINEFPTSRYIVGRLAPLRAAEDDTAAIIDPTENDSLAVGAADDEDGVEETQIPLIIGFNPSSFGLSFLVDADVETLCATVTWGDYRKEKIPDRGDAWRRYHREALVQGIPIKSAGSLPQIPLSSSTQNALGVLVTGVDDSEIVLEGVIRDFSGYRAVSLFLVNRRTKGALGDRSKDERWIFQPQISIRSSDGSAIFVAKDFQAEPIQASDGDGEEAISSLLYMHAREFATGHGVAVGWDLPTHEGQRTTCVFTEFIPQHEVPLLIAPIEQTGGATLDMKVLAETTTSEQISSLLKPMVTAYDEWIVRIEKASLAIEIQQDSELRGAAAENIRRCKECANRMHAGLRLIQEDEHVFEAFRFSNQVMWDQRIHSLWSAANRKLGAVNGNPIDFDNPANRTWRPFQMGFILLNLIGIADEASTDRCLVDLLWFPTGGGKTEAYLGISAFTLALRRLRGERHGMCGDAGVSIIMRYTLRLLTVQQFQRAAALICACEVARRNAPSIWGKEPFQIGIWVGRSTTPNTFEKSKNAIDDIKNGKRPSEGSPIQLVSCPRCGTALIDDKGVPKGTYQVDVDSQRTLIWCANGRCEFSAKRSENRGLPVVVVDDEIYRMCPSLIVATVDKFARIPFKGETRLLFGLRDRYSLTYGHISEAHGDKVGGRTMRDARPAARLLPPELIIQDELHLISGPLGTMVGLYETALDFVTSLTSLGQARIPSKVIASTATIRRAAQQAYQLYGGRKLAIFPPSGLSSKDSFFAREINIDETNDRTAGRLYIGINAPGSSTKTLLVRVYSALLAVGGYELTNNPDAADPYGTLIGYFNSLRALGGAKRLVEDDVKLIRLKYLSKQRNLPYRKINEPEELTSRIDSWKIPALLKKLDIPFPRGKSDWPIDILLATNMISVGVDIDRLGLMVVTGQPKTSAEYIQATSRVGRKYPGLIVTMYNWMGARDLSHYERFISYHAALYRYVEAISVTPFSSRALDRGLRGIFAAINRLMGSHMAKETDAKNFNPQHPETNEIIEQIYHRATVLVGRENADLVRERLLAYCDDWGRLAEDALLYSWISSVERPRNNSRVLLRTSGTQNYGEWSTPGSLREVEPTAAFFLNNLETK